MRNINRIDINEALRYLGYNGQELTPQMQRLIDDASDLCLKTAVPKYTYKLFSVKADDSRVTIAGTELAFESTALAKHLAGCDECAIMCVTIGATFDKKLTALQATEPTKAVIFNSCGSALTEQVCDALEEEILRSTGKEKHNFRFSPGYGDLPLSAQKTVFQLLSPEKTTGIHLLPDGLLFPIKSVTAILGLSPTKKEITENKCSLCNLRDTCLLRKRGNTCENPGLYKEKQSDI